MTTETFMSVFKHQACIKYTFILMTGTENKKATDDPSLESGG